MPKCFHHFFIDEGKEELFNSGSMSMILWEIGLDMKAVGPARYSALNKSSCKNRGKTDNHKGSHNQPLRKYLKYSSSINLK